ncbi:M15 family metallopeptidase [Rhizobium sp. TRM95111]|uniref:M15 family metallopeptidase n=1 Tax=Rhizobium alarense TaxID=2846851 RepID=UPI001F3CAE72|nr:M15 family metallopeptidase [Rhizobium alarense]MCF3642772.1 M15 family metallopeptidase [Rhizobium alarense]
MTISTSRWIEPALVAALCLSCAPAAPAAEPDPATRLDLLARAYPETIARIGEGLIHFRDGGAPLAVDDGRSKSHAEAVAEGDVEDSLSQLYAAGACEAAPGVDHDPGRIRSDALMKRLYGGSARAVEEALVRVDWFGGTVRVTKRQGAASALGRVRDALAGRPDLRRYLAPSAGTFNWRRVAGQPNLSVHSFGAAIDLNTAFADYWIWSGGKPGRVPEYRNKYPMAIVEAFERQGFIWGGRWYHYDTMHFEYRPELIAIGAAAGVSACGQQGSE